jgi:hypothetical protein
MEQKQTHHRQLRPPCCRGRLLRFPSRLLSLGGGACRGSGAFRAERAQANHRATSPCQRPPRRHRRPAAATSTRNCSPQNNVEPATRRLGGRRWVAVPSRSRKEHAVHRRLRPVAVLYVPVVLELSWSFANAAQPSSSAPSSASVCAPSPLLTPIAYSQYNRPLIRQPPAHRRPSLRRVWVRVHTRSPKSILTVAASAPST